MIIVCGNYTDNIGKIQEMTECDSIPAKIAVLNRNGFLPKGVLSPYDYFTSGQNGEIREEKELFYNFLEVPEFWEIRAAGISGAVYDMNCKKADIYFREPVERRNVQRVEWHMENGWVYRIDYYDKYARKYACEFLDESGKVESRVFYTDKNQEVIVEQPQNEVITLLENGKTKAFFTSYAEFTEYFLEKVAVGESRALLIQEQEEFGLLDFEQNGKSLWNYIFFLNDELLNRYTGMGGKNGYGLYIVPKEYPANLAGREALILTASDQLEGIEDLIAGLPEVMFHIAANTQVSDKLYKLGERENVKIYPQISRQDLDLLWNQCSYYLDINYFREIHNAVDSAHQKNLLIMGFENTLHRRELTTEECVFPGQNHEKLILAIKNLIDDPTLVKELLIKQQNKKQAKWDAVRKLWEE